MQSLRDLQIQFEMDLFDTSGNSKCTYIKKDGISAQVRMAIYRNNVFSNYREALGAVYPVVKQIVGEKFFRKTADSYITAYPSQSGDLNGYGAHFSHFLAGFEPAKQLVYLPDVAYLEWQMELVFHAADDTSSVMEKLSVVPEDQYGELRFKVHPAVRLFQSHYPIARIWEVNQSDWQGDDAVNLQMGGCQLLIFRENFAVTIRPLTSGEFTMLHGLAAGEDMNTTFCKACAIESDLDLGAFLQRMIHESILVDLID